MNNGNRFRTMCCLVFSLCIFVPTGSLAVSLSVESTTVSPGAAVNVQITIDQPAEVAAAFFAVTYNTDYFLLTSVESPFFGTFSEQWQSLTPVPNPFPPPEIQVEGVTYTSPVVYKLFDGKALLAGTRVKAGQTATGLFTLNFTVADNVPNGIYPVSIEAVAMNNESCGYPATGETLPILIGAAAGESDLSKAFPSLPISLINGAFLVQTAVSDTDQDGIDDAWEENIFGSLDIADAFSDWDKDGYTDLQEYLNQLAGETDPQGNAYHPKGKNAPGGTGYRKSVIIPWLFLLLKN